MKEIQIPSSPQFGDIHWLAQVFEKCQCVETKSIQPPNWLIADFAIKKVGCFLKVTAK